MTTKRLIAIKDFSFTRRLSRQVVQLTAGEEFEVEPIEAAALVYQHKAKFAPLSAARQTASIPDRPLRRRYRRRDLRAEE